jgi:hypothetical protein
VDVRGHAAGGQLERTVELRVGGQTLRGVTQAARSERHAQSPGDDGTREPADGQAQQRPEPGPSHAGEHHECADQPRCRRADGEPAVGCDSHFRLAAGQVHTIAAGDQVRQGRDGPPEDADHYGGDQ